MTGPVAVAEPIDVCAELAPDCGLLNRLARVVLAGWQVPGEETERVLRAVEGMRGELLRRCEPPARVRMELSKTWRVLTLVMACRDVLAVEYFDVSGFLLGMGAEAAR